MSGLPPYSTYRTDPKQMQYPQQLSHGNILTFTPPGFKQTLNVKFPDCRLAVCERCKKNYKTRDMCRVRNSHTSEPWTTAYIAFTLDDNCTDDDGKYVDKPFAVRMIQWQPYCVKAPFDSKTPVCSACKKTNRTRSFCRERHKHRQLPWCTVYVLLSPADTIDPSTKVAPEGIPIESSSSVKTEVKDEEKTENVDLVVPEEEKSTKETDEKDAQIPKVSRGDGDDINDIAESRTFLAKVSCKESSIHWLEMADFDMSESIHGLVSPDGGHVGFNRGQPGMPPHMDPHSGYYAAHAMAGYGAQQHQYNLKAHQQYFFHMQQRQQQQYAAHQAAWQAQYNQQAQLASHGGQPVPAPHAPPGAPPQPAPAPVTAGEAAAQQSKMAPAPAGQEQTAGAAAAAAQQHQAYGQWAAHPPPPGHMAYHQQMYQNQMASFQQSGGVIPGGGPAPPEGGGPPPPQMQPPPDHGYAPPPHPPPHGVPPGYDQPPDGRQPDPKRQRTV